MEPISILGLTVYPYGLAVSAAAALCLALAALSFRRMKADARVLSWFAPLAVALGLLGSRAGFCLAAFDWVAQDGPGFFFQFARGGYMLYGTLAGCALALLISCRICRSPFAPAADALAAPGMLMIALCRLAEGLVNQGYGWPIEDWFMEDSGMSLFVWEDPSVLYGLPFGVADYYGSYNWAVFVFEALVALGIAAALVKVRVNRAGGRAALMLVLYAATQVLCESLRQDAVLRWGFVRVNQIIGGVVLAGALALCFALSRKRSGRRLAISIGAMLLSMAVVIAMEFALEKKISAIEWMPMDVCYLLMGLACAGLIGCILPHWKRAFAHVADQA